MQFFIESTILSVMKRCLFFFLFFSVVNGDLWVIDQDLDVSLTESKKNRLFVSLGSSCVPAGLLRESDLRKEAFPFDWCLSLDNEALSLAIEENLIRFLETDYLIPDSLLLAGASGACLIHLLYRFEFVHEGDFRGEENVRNMRSFQERYQRRVERFRRLADYTGTVIFLRSSYKYGFTDPHRYFKSQKIVDISDEDAIRLYKALQNRFSTLTMKLLILNEGDSPEDSLIVEKIIQNSIWKIRHTFSSEQAMYAEYQKFLHSLEG